MKSETTTLFGSPLTHVDLDYTDDEWSVSVPPVISVDGVRI